MFEISSKYLDVVFNAPVTSACFLSPSHNKTGIYLQPGGHIRAHRFPNYSSIHLGAKSNKSFVQQKGLLSAQCA